MAENPQGPLLDRMGLEQQFGGYTPSGAPEPLPNIPFRGLRNPMPGGSGDQPVSSLDALDAAIRKPLGEKRGGSILRPLSEMSNPRYDSFVPGDYNNEDAYAQGQSWTDKMVNGVGKGLALTGTTFLQGTVGLVNGVGNWISTGNFSSFYDNELNRALDTYNKELDDNLLPNYYTNVEKNAAWYSTDNLFTANFLWNSIVKNLGFAAGAYLSGGVYATGIKALSSLPGISRLVSIGKQAEVLAATEAGLMSANKAADTYGKIKTLSDRFLTSYKVLNPGGRAVVAGLATTGEAGFEALQNLNEERDKLIQEYMIENEGVYPKGEALDAINRKAEQVGDASFWANVGLLTATNYIQFPKIFGSSYTAEKGMINSLARETKDIIEEGGKYVTKPFFTNRVLSTLNNIRPYTFSASEAFEEGAQFAIGVSTRDYFNKKNNNEPTSFLDSLSEGITQTFGTDEGMENIIIGGLSGAIMLGRSRYMENRQKARNTADAIERFNRFRLSDFTKDTIDSVNRGTVLQQEREELLKRGDVLNSKDKEADYAINYLSPRIKYGRFDLVQADINDYRTLASTDEGFAQLVSEGKALPTDTKEAFLARLENLQLTANNVKSLYQSLNLRYAGQVDEQGKPIYPSSVIDQMVYAASKVADYDVRIPKLSPKLAAAGINVDEVVADIVEGKVESFNAAVDTIKSMKDLTDDQKEDLGRSLEDVAEMSIRRDNFLKEYNEMKKAPEKFSDAEITVDEMVDEDGNPISSVKVKTREGDKEFVVGEEYFAGSPIRKSKEGVEFTEFSKFKFLGTTEDGNKISVETADGKKLNIPIDTFEKYKIGDLAAVEKRPNAKFYIESAGQIFTYQLGRGKKPIKGTIQYDVAKDQLKFVTLDGKRTYLVDRSRFVAKEGFDKAQIYSSGKLTKIAEDALSEPITSEELAALYNQRDAIINEVVTTNKKRLEEVEKNLETSRKELASVTEALNNVTLTKKGLPKKNMSKAIRKTVNQLSDTKLRLEKNIVSLEAEQSDLEDTLFYFNDILQYKDELPQEYSEIIKDLKQDVNTLEDLIDNTNSALKDSKSILSNVEDALKKALSLLDDFAKRLAEENPNFPISVDALRDRIEKYLGEEGANQFIADKLGFTEAVMDLEDQISLFADELGIPDLTKQAEDLKKDITELEQQLNDLINTQVVKGKLMEVFETAASEYRKRLEQEAIIQNDPNLRSSLMKTEFKGVQIEEEDPSKKYEPTAKKSDEIIWRATMGINRGKAHQTRANTFGFNLGKFQNRNDIRGVYVTSKNEDQLVPGLTDRLRMNDDGVIDENIKKDEIIALVMVIEDETGKLIPVGVDGQPIPEGVSPVDAAIYQVFPDTELQWGAEFDNESMFRNPNEEDRKPIIDSIKEQYKKWRESVLKNPDLSELHQVDASFGRVQEVRDNDGNLVYETRTSVEDAGLITADNLEADVVINVPTLNTVVSKGTVSFNSPLGRVFLETPTGLVKLQNKQFSREEAQTIFEAILQLSKYWIGSKQGLKDPKAERLLTWLRSTVYWGIPNDQKGNRKPTGYNSIFFDENEETGTTMLTISNKGEDFAFSPLSLEENKELIINMISGLYNNINNFMVKQKDESYEEILSVSENGEVSSRVWKNYQSYLLSNTTPDGKKRSGEQLPLSTRVRPLANEEDVNRTDIYFFTTDTADDFVIPVVEKKKPIISKTLTPGAPKPKAAPVSTDAKADIERRRQEELNKAFDNNKNTLEAQINKAIKDKGWKTDNVLFHGGPKFDKFDKQFFQTGEYSNVDMRRVAESMGVRIPEGNFSFSATPITSLTYALRYGKNNPTLYIVNKTESLNAKELTGNEEKDAQEWIIDGDNIFDTISVPLIPNADKINAKYDAELAALEGAKPAIEEDEDTFVIGEEEEAPTGYVLDGATTNVYTSPKGKKIKFKATNAASPDNLDAIEVLAGEDFEEVRDALKAAGKDPKFEIRMSIYKAIEPTIAENLQEDDDAVFQIPTEAVEKVETETGKKLSPSVKSAINKKIRGLNNEALRVVIQRELKTFVPENWNQVEVWLKANFPNVPVYRVKNIIQATNGRQAWGMFKDGAIYIYENAEVGTVYHEVFHAVWRMFSDPAEQKAVLDEMRARGGKFFDRASLKDVKYSEATEDQLEEKLAEEFRDYVQQKKIPAKPAKGRPYILKLFADMVTAIKEFFLGPDSQTKVDKMFSKIGQGYYKTYLPLANSLAYAKEGIIDIEDAFADSDSVLSLAGITDVERSEIIQHMTYLTLADLIKTDRSLFEVPNINKTELYNKLRDQILETIAQKARVTQSLVDDGAFTQEEVQPILSHTLQLMEGVYNQWDLITARHEEYLRGYQIEFDENDNITINDENKSGKETWQDATKIDSFKKANSAVKLLLATVPKVNDDGSIEPSSIGGAQLLPIGKTYISLMNNLHTSASVEEMVERLREMAESDPNYRTLYKRIVKKDWKEKGVDLSNLKTQHSLQLLSSIWRTFKKQNPDVKNVFILENGDVVVGEANLSTAAQQLRSEYISSIVFKAKQGKGFFRYDENDKVFKGDPKSISQVKLDNARTRIDFLDRMGIPFTMSDVSKMNGDQRKMFNSATDGIRESISKADKIATFSGKVLDIHKRLLELALVKAAVTNPEFSSTYFNVAGERTQSFIGTNAGSDLYEFLSKLERFNDDTVAGTRYNYLRTDSFAKNSNLLSRMFTSEGTRKKGSEELFKIGYVSGTVNEGKGKRKESSRLTYKERLVQELNLNLAGYYLNLIPGDASIEWMINMGNPISTRSLDRGFGDMNEIFKGYFLSELELVREDRPVAKDRDTKEMRFFKGILGDKLHADVLKAKGTPEAVYNRFQDKINAKLEEFIRKDTIKLKKTLEQYGILKETAEGFELENIDLPSSMSETVLNRNMIALAVNYMIANIEMHKLLYSDPYQYEDELKRIKSFNSPRQAVISGSPKMNAAFNEVWNEGYKPGDIGHTKFTQDYFRSATHADVIGVIDLPNYKDFKETDGSGIINMKGNRHFRIRAGEWNSDEERQYKYDVAWEKRDKGESLSEQDKKKKGLLLSPAELALLAAGNPGIQSAYTPIKPIVSGSKLGKDGLPSSYNDVVLDKFALYPLSYRILKEINKDANAIKLYDKMQAEDIDYVVFTSGRKVGAEKPHSTYNEDGSFNNDAYKAVVNVPFSIMSIQAEVPSKDEANVTRGSQVTKLVTLDFLEAGVPVDFMEDEPNFNKRYKAWYELDEDQKLTDSELYRNIRENQELLEALIEDGYQRTLDKLGIKETILRDKDGEILERQYQITDRSKVAQTLRDEILKREVNDNISDALAGFLEGKVVLEATVAYQQVRNILYSIADKEFISPKINGGLKVQIPSTLIESNRVAITEINGKKGYTSDVLNFYEKDGKRVAEVMLGRWFDSPLSDEELLDYLNNTEEGQKILSGIGFRIPTQKQNSIDAIVVKKFLPKEFGDSVVIPAALVAKVGSDFDIDKLSVYLKNVYRDAKGNVKLVPFYGYGQQAKDKFEDLFSEIAEEKIDIVKEQIKSLGQLQQLLGDILTGKAKQKTSEKWTSILRNMFGQTEASAIDVEGVIMTRLEKKGKQLEDLNDFTLQEILMEEFKERMYKKSLENAYIQNMENLVTSRANYANLIKPNSAEPLKELGEFIAEKTVGSTFDYKNVDNMLDRTFMSRLRHAFVTGKYAIGIAAVNQTNHSLNQRQPIYIDSSRLSLLSNEDKFWLRGNTDIKFDKYNSIEINGKMVPTLSMIKNKAGEFISDIIGMFIDGYVDISKGPWIMELGATPNVASTWLFLIKLGVPVKTVAYFMNQPIIRDYLRTIESAGYSWLFIDQFVEDMGELYGQEMSEKELKSKLATFKIPSETALRSNLGKGIKEMTSQQKQDQFLMLNEFLRYAKMAEQLFHVTQGANYDTSTFNDPSLVFKKQMQQVKAKNTIINSVDTLLANSFIGQLADSINKVRDAFAEILRSDSPKVRNIIQKVLLPYVNNSDREFVKISQKVVNDLFDWAVQNDQKLNAMIKDILIKDGGVGREAMMFVNEVKKNDEHPLNGNQVIEILQAIPSMRAEEGGVNNVKLNMGENKVYDQNNIIYAFRELRDYLKGENDPLYDRLVTLAVLQSGLSNSGISFTSLVPYEDFEKIYNKTLSKLEGMPNLDDFYELGVFQRNNWNNDDVVPYLKAAWIQGKERKYYNPSMEFLPKGVTAAVNAKVIPPVLTRSLRNREANSDYIVYTWENKISKKEKDEMRRAGDYSYINKGLFRKVYDKYGKPLVHVDYMGREYFVYKAINAWGDGFRANEFWSTDHKSVIANGFVEVEDVDNDLIIDAFNNKLKVSAKVTAPSVSTTATKITPLANQPEFNKLPGKSATPTMTYAGIGSRQTPPQVIKQMTEVAKELASKGYTLNTGVTFGGKEEGADAAFSRGATKKNLFSPEKQGSRAKEQTIAKEVHPNPGALSQGALKLMARNTNQVFGDNLDKPVDFVLFWAKETKGIRPEGGTGQAVEMARRKGIPTINMADANWKEQLNTALIGKTQIKPKGLPAIKNKNQKSCG